MNLEMDIAFGRSGFALTGQAELSSKTTAVVGASASGKTTLLHLLAGLLKLDKGLIKLDGKILADTSKGLHLRPHHRQIGVVFQDGRLFPHLNVRANLRYGQPRHAKQDFCKIVDLLGLSDLLERSPEALSGGQQRRVALGRALLYEPRLLLLDEPFTGLDAVAAGQMIRLLINVREELDVRMLLVSHQLSHVLQLTENLLLLEAGSLVGVGRYRDLVQQSQTLELLLGGGLSSVLPMRVREQDLSGGCAVFVSETSSLEMRGPLCHVPVGSLVHLSIDATDVAITRSPIADISIRNQLPGVIQRRIDRDGLVVLEVDVGLPLLVEVSLGSARKMALETGAKVWCLIKSNAVGVLRVLFEKDAIGKSSPNRTLPDE